MNKTDASIKLRSIPIPSIFSNQGMQVNGSQQFHDHLNKCRCCFNEFEKGKRKVEITEWHREVYRLVIKTELRMDLNLSSHLCENCNDNMKNLSEFVQVVEVMAVRCDEEKYTVKDEFSSYDIIDQNGELKVVEDIEIEEKQFSTHQVEFATNSCETDAGLISTVNLNSDFNSEKDSTMTKTPYNYCDLCGYQSTEKRYILNHMKNMHKFKEFNSMQCEKISGNEIKLRKRLVVSESFF